ncbi:MAG: hypothetical protein ACLR6B_13620 [Blautia sp.]
MKYHFMFQFLVGNLEYLGLRLDLGYNLVSILSLAGFLMVLYGISYRMFKASGQGQLPLFSFFSAAEQRSGVICGNIFRRGTLYGLWKKIRRLSVILPMKTGDYGISMYI